jgi:putative transposase
MNSFTRQSDSPQPAAETAVYLFDAWFDPIEAEVPDRVRDFIQAMSRAMRHWMCPRYGRAFLRSVSQQGEPRTGTRNRSP